MMTRRAARAVRHAGTRPSVPLTVCAVARLERQLQIRGSIESSAEVSVLIDGQEIFF